MTDHDYADSDDDTEQEWGMDAKLDAACDSVTEGYLRMRADEIGNGGPHDF